MCTFHLSACLNVTDARLPACRAQTIDVLKARHPSSIRPRDSVEAADSQPFLSALESFGTTVRKGDTIFQQGTPQSGHDRCTQPFVQLVPHAPAAVGRRLLSAGAVATSGDSTSNRIALACAPNPSVCGNGVIEVTEQCDDGNTVSCDGCSDHCRREICGNRVVDCGEQCDDGPGTVSRATRAARAALGTRPPAASLAARPRVIAWPSGRSRRASWRSRATGSRPTNRPASTTTRAATSTLRRATAASTSGSAWAATTPRLGCAASAVASLGLRRPSASQTAAAAARQVSLDAFGRLPLPTAAPGEACSGRVDLDVPAGRKRLVVSADAFTTEGLRDRDSIKLTCVPAP